MPRSRNIKPGFFTNEELVEVDPLGRILFIGLWTLADREGRLEDRPKRIKMELLPCDNCDIDSLLNALDEHGFIKRYVVAEKPYIQVINFKKHQNPHIKEAKSVIPAPDKLPVQEIKTPDIQLTNNNSINESPVQAPDNTDTNTVQAPIVADASHADSLLLIPDSLNNIKTLSGKPNDVPKIIDYLNQKLETQYKSTAKKTVALIRARIAEGFGYQDFITVIDKKIKEWLGTENQIYLRPETLFGTKFEGYLNQKEAVAYGRPEKYTKAHASPNNGGTDWNKFNG